MKIYIKYMVSARCKLIVKTELEKLGFHSAVVELGEADLKGTLSSSQRAELAKALKKVDLELIEDKRTILVEKIKIVIIKLIHFSEKKPVVKKISDYLAQKLNYSYTYLSNLFSQKENTTIERYVILQKVERVKELLMYNELTLAEISFEVQYSSVAHLCNQFKKVTGMTPTTFKRLREKRRGGIDDV